MESANQTASTIIDQKSRILNYALDIERRKAEISKTTIDTNAVETNFRHFWKLVSESE
jgi:hypothetical protein